MIIGSVGSGKSSLVSAILGEMTTLSGTVQYNESVFRISTDADNEPCQRISKSPMLPHKSRRILTILFVWKNDSYDIYERWSYLKMMVFGGIK